MIALAWASGSACSHRRRDAGRDTPVYLLDLRRPSDGRRAHWVSAGRDAQLQRRLPLAFMTNGLACLSASLWVLRIKRLAPAIVPTVCPEKNARSHVWWLRDRESPANPDPTTVSRSAPFIRSEPCVCRRVRGWDLKFESGLLQRGVLCEPEIPSRRSGGCSPGLLRTLAT